MIKYRASRVFRRFFYQFHHGPKSGGLRPGITLLTVRYNNAIKIMNVEYRLDIFLVEFLVLYVIRAPVLVLRENGD